jgi:hypothetical protein
VKDKLLAFFANHGIKVIVTGFLIASTGAILLITAQHRTVFFRNISLAIGLTGFSIYLIGRIGMIAAQRHARKLRTALLHDDDVEEKENE